MGAHWHRLFVVGRLGLTTIWKAPRWFWFGLTNIMDCWKIVSVWCMLRLIWKKRLRIVCTTVIPCPRAFRYLTDFPRKFFWHWPADTMEICHFWGWRWTSILNHWSRVYVWCKMFVECGGGSVAAVWCEWWHYQSVWMRYYFCWEEKQEPWGTSAAIDRVLANSLPTLTRKERSERNDWITLMRWFGKRIRVWKPARVSYGKAQLVFATVPHPEAELKVWEKNVSFRKLLPSLEEDFLSDSTERVKKAN